MLSKNAINRDFVKFLDTFQTSTPKTAFLEPFQRIRQRFRHAACLTRTQLLGPLDMTDLAGRETNRRPFFNSSLWRLGKCDKRIFGKPATGNKGQ